jgi:hypothetical protein
LKKLGKLPVKHDPRMLKLVNYLPPVLPIAPDPVDWGQKAASLYQPFGNDQWGDCFWAMGANGLITWSANVAKPISLTQAEVLTEYARATGFAYTDATDNGTVMLDGLKYLRTTGIAGNKIGAFMKVNSRNHAEVLSALYLFGALLIGVQFPGNWMDAPIWDVSNSPIEGGHAILGMKGSLSASLFSIVTWGEERTLTFAGADQNVDEMYVTLAPEWLNDHSLAPNGFNMAQLTADLNQITA